jgi:hypothetical protein
MKLAKLLSLSISISAFLLMTACNKLERRLNGTWDVTKVEFTIKIGALTFSDQGQDVQGTISFNKGTGKQNYSFKYNGNTYTFYDNFTYTLSEEYITTSHTDKWLRLMNTEQMQKAQYTQVINTNETRTYTLTLEK